MYKPVVPPRMRSSLPAVDTQGFFDAVGDALTLYMSTEEGAPPAGTKPQYVHAWPRERLTKADDPFDVITFRVLNAGMAPTMRDGAAPMRIDLRETKPHPTLAGYNLLIYAWSEDATFEFCVWSRSNNRADVLTAWFHKFLMVYAHGLQYFKARGVQNFRFVARRDDDFDPEQGQELYRRRLVYAARLEVLNALVDKQLTSVDINIAVPTQTDTISVSD